MLKLRWMALCLSFQTQPQASRNLCSPCIGVGHMRRFYLMQELTRKTLKFLWCMLSFLPQCIFTLTLKINALQRTPRNLTSSPVRLSVCSLECKNVLLSAQICKIKRTRKPALQSDFLIITRVLCLAEMERLELSRRFPDLRP